MRHPETAWSTRTSILVGIDPTDEGGPAEFKICSPLHVNAVEPIMPSGSMPAGIA